MIVPASRSISNLVISISGLVCISALSMVLVVVVGNHWRGRLILVPSRMQEGFSKVSDEEKMTRYGTIYMFMHMIHIYTMYTACIYIPSCDIQYARVIICHKIIGPYWLLIVLLMITDRTINVTDRTINVTDRTDWLLAELADEQTFFCVLFKLLISNPYHNLWILCFFIRNLL